ncbi:hypothetical protein PTKIN_Ptkin08bG0062500 [Pterospermum kingtungense]
MDSCLDGGGCGSSLRLRVELDVTKPLRRAVKIFGGGNKKETWARVSYEILSAFCYCCGLLGHSEGDCEADNSEGDNSKCL